jgi:hypothetical protein
MTFSICHASARPLSWRKSYDAWMQRAEHPESVEYILGVHESQAADFTDACNDGVRVEINPARRCMVDGYTPAVKVATGSVLILDSDDIFPPEQWDSLLLESLAGRDPLVDDFVVQVASGGHADERGLMVLPILSRARYERLGYAFYPEYESMYADDDFSEHARIDGAVIDARHLLFPHEHPPMSEWDTVYHHQNRRESYAVGETILARRRATGFRGE